MCRPRGIIEFYTDNAGYWRYFVFGTHTTATLKGYGCCKDPHEWLHQHFALFAVEHLRNHAFNAGLKILKLECVNPHKRTKKIDRILAMVPHLQHISKPHIAMLAVKV